MNDGYKGQQSITSVLLRLIILSFSSGIQRATIKQIRPTKPTNGVNNNVMPTMRRRRFFSGRVEGKQHGQHISSLLDSLVDSVAVGLILLLSPFVIADETDYPTSSSIDNGREFTIIFYKVITC